MPFRVLDIDAITAALAGDFEVREAHNNQLIVVPRAGALVVDHYFPPPRGVSYPRGTPLPHFDALTERIASGCGIPSDVTWGTAVYEGSLFHIQASRSAWRPSLPLALYTVTAILRDGEDRPGKPWELRCGGAVIHRTDWVVSPRLRERPELTVQRTTTTYPGYFVPPANMEMGHWVRVGAGTTVTELLQPPPHRIDARIESRFQCVPTPSRARAVVVYQLDLRTEDTGLVEYAFSAAPPPVLDLYTGEVVGADWQREPCTADLAP